MIYNSSNSNQTRACGANAAMPFYQPMAQPVMAGQAMAQPVMTGQGMMQPMMAQPATMQSPMTGQGVMQPMMTQPATMQSPMAGQSMMQPMMTQPAMMQSPMAGQSMMQPMMTQPGMMQMPIVGQGMMQSPVAQTTNLQSNTVGNSMGYDQNTMSMQTAQMSTNYQNTMMPTANYPMYGTAPVCGGQMPVSNQVVATQTTPVSESQSTTAHHKKTTYVEAYIQPTTTSKPTTTTTMTTQQYPLTDTMVYTAQQQPKNSSMQDYNLYLLEKEYYGDDSNQPVYTKQTTYRDANPQVATHLTCENLPLATSYVKMQPYTNLNDSNTTLQQGTAFADLYMPYTPKKVPTRGGNQHE